MPGLLGGRHPPAKSVSPRSLTVRSQLGRLHDPRPGLDPDSEFVELAAEVFSLLSDPTRVRIILALRRAGELSVNALAETVDKKPSGVSQHLARLRMARMVTTRQEGTSVLYKLTDEHAIALVVEAVKQAEHAVANGQAPRHHDAPG